MASAAGKRDNDHMTVTVSEQLSFGETLRQWRDRRRISQLELAIRAGTTQRYLSFVERGRSVPGRGMVVRLAESLELPLRERNALLTRAGYAPIYPERSLSDDDLRVVEEALHLILAGHEPYPAMIVNRLGDLISANDACDVFFVDVAEHLLHPPLNTRRLALHPQGLPRRMINFNEWAPHVTDSLRREWYRNPDPALETLLKELDGYVLSTPVPPNHVGFAVPLELGTRGGILRLITTLTAFTTATDVFLSEIRLEAFLPADDQSADLLRRYADARASAKRPSR